MFGFVLPNALTATIDSYIGSGRLMVEESSKARGIPLACRVVSAIATFPSFSGSQQRFGDRPGSFRLLFRKPRSLNLRYLHHEQPHHRMRQRRQVCEGHCPQAAQVMRP